MSLVQRKAMVFAVDDNSYLPFEITENTARPYSCGVVGKSVQTGMTYEEVGNCPALIAQIGVSDKSNEFVEKTDEFWSDWKIEIPLSRVVEGGFPNARVLDGSYEIINGKVIPVDINDYVAYNMMLKDGTVGKTEEDLQSEDQFDFFMFDISKQERIESEKVEKTKLITLKLAEILNKDDSREIVRQILINSKEYSYYDITQMSDTKATEEIFKYANKQSVKFLEIAQNKNLSDISFANELIMSDIVKEAGGTYYNGEDKIGDLKSLVLYLRNPSKLIEVDKLKSLLDSYKLMQSVSS